MSMNWDLYCKQCDSWHGFHDANHQDGKMLAIAKHAKAIAGLVDLMKESEYLGISLPTGNGDLDPQWFADHLDHGIVPRNEYGQYLDEAP